MIKKFNKIITNNLFVFIGLAIIIFTAYSSLFNSYFESDEWFYFTYYFPLTRESFGALTAVVSTIINSDYISGSQHVVPIASLIYFFNTKFFGLNFVPYAFMSLLLHSINSFLVFVLIKALLHKKNTEIKNLYAALGAVFFALSPVPMHAITWAGFYGQSVLSVTFSILCLLFYKFAFIRREKKFIYFSAVFLFLALFTKESTFFLFLVLPLMTVIEERVFPIKFLGKIFLSLLVIYLIFRFLIPNISTLPDKIVDIYLSSYSTRQTETREAGSITSRGLSIHKNLLGEITFRTITFPIKMAGSLFLPPENAMLTAKILAPVITPIIPGGDQSAYSSFINYSGPTVIIYLTSLAIIIFVLKKIINLRRNKKYDEAKALVIAVAIIALGALPLVAIIFTFPLWGYAVFFDSRHHYNPAVGASILFPFLVFGAANSITKISKAGSIMAVALLVFVVWILYSAYAFDKGIKAFAQNYGEDRREVVKQLKNLLPELPTRTVFYFEKDGKAPFASLPFFTSVPQVLSIVYYDVSPLPDSFYNKTLFSGEPEGYQFSDGRGLGFYITKEKLLQDLRLGNFEINDIYAFYYYGADAKLTDITKEIRKEANTYAKSE